MTIDLRISGIMYNQLWEHLFPGDGNEAVAIALCGRVETHDSAKILVHKVIPIPIEDCILRTPVKIKWCTHKLVEILGLASVKGFSILKIHSHPTAYPEFSSIDDESDREIFSSVFSWVENVKFHASAVMLPDGKIFARSIAEDLTFTPLNKIMVVGDDIRYYQPGEIRQVEDFNIRTAQTFGPATTSLLRTLTAAVVGCSGTGSPVIEQLVRLGFGKIVLVDPDRVESKNLNRILNSRMCDVDSRKAKVDVLGDAIRSIDIGTVVDSCAVNLFDDVATIQRVACSDVVFGCMDSVDGRHLLSSIAAFYLVPYFDLGVKLIADGTGGIDQVWGTVHYLQPGKSSLLTRGVYNQDDIGAAGLFRVDPQKYKSLKREGYIKNVNVESPAVISVNMQIASLAVLEFLARVHKFRHEPNSEAAITRISLTDCYIQRHPECATDIYLEKFVGRGTIAPLLNMPELSQHVQ